MKNIQTGTNETRLQSWTIFADQAASANPVSRALSQVPRIPSPSLLSPEGTILEAVDTLERRLFDNRIDLKIAFYQLVMYLSAEWREVVFAQIDRLLDFKNWEPDSSLIQKSTFVTFLRFIVLAKPTKIPSLGVGTKGYLLAAWIFGTQTIAVEFLPNDQASMSFVRDGTRSKEVLVWRGHIVDLKLFMERNDMMNFLQGDGD